MCGAYRGLFPERYFLLMALLLNRNIVVPLSNESREKHLDMFEDAKVNQIIEINENDSWTLREGSESASHPLLDDLRERRESGIIIFTSGTSGKSKASVLSAGRSLEKYKTAKRKPSRTLIFLKLDHIGGINTLFAILFNGEPSSHQTAERRSPFIRRSTSMLSKCSPPPRPFKHAADVQGGCRL